MAFRCQRSVKLEASWPTNSQWMKLLVSPGVLDQFILLEYNSFIFPFVYLNSSDLLKETLFVVHAAVIAINEAVEKGQASATMAALTNPNAMLRKPQEALAQEYQDTLSQAKTRKQAQSSGRVRSHNFWMFSHCILTRLCLKMVLLCQK